MSDLERPVQKEIQRYVVVFVDAVASSLFASASIHREFLIDRLARNQRVRLAVLPRVVSH